MLNNFLLAMNGICKSFSGTEVLHQVNLKVSYGEIHGIMGENGAGKSTLIKILTGIYHKDFGVGEIVFDGNVINPKTAIDAQRLGISAIYQEINLIKYLSIAENIFLGRQPKKHGFIDWKQMNEQSQEIMLGLGINVDVRKGLGEYGTAIQQMVAIARAISINAKLVVMDEPTSSLDEDEVSILFGVIRKLKERGISIIYISHRLNEVFEITDKITILRDGYVVGYTKTSEIDRIELVSKMIGKDASEIINNKKKKLNNKISFEYICEAINIKSVPKVKDLSINIKKGEIVGLAGLLGSGRTEFAKILFGDNAPDDGIIKVNGRPIKFNKPSDAIRLNFAFCTEDRKNEGIFPDLSLKENIMMANLSKIKKIGVINKSEENFSVNKYINDLRIKVQSIDQPISNLSGGNQQKALLARWLITKPELIILDEPTRGIDVGAKSEIEKLIQSMAQSGISILMISSELEELVRGCDRIIVIREGYNVGEISHEDISEEMIMKIIADSHEKAETKISS